MADIKTRLLYYSAHGDNSNLEKLLNNRKINLNIIKDTKGNTPLILASANGHLDTVNFLLSNGADPDSVNNKDDRELNNRNNLGRTPILEASANGHAEVVDLLYTKTDGYDRDNDGNSSIILASANGHINVVGLLLSYGDDEVFNKEKKFYGINDRNESKETPLIVASKNGHLIIVDILLGMARSEREFIQLINQKDNMNYTSIMWAFAKGHTDVVNLLLSRGANIPENASEEMKLFFINLNVNNMFYVLTKKGMSKEEAAIIAIDQFDVNHISDKAIEIEMRQAKKQIKKGGKKRNTKTKKNKGKFSKKNNS